MCYCKFTNALKTPFSRIATLLQLFEKYQKTRCGFLVHLFSLEISEISASKESIRMSFSTIFHQRNCPRFGLRTERTGRNQWRVTWAFPIKESAACHEGYDRVSVKGDIEFDTEYPGCPYCGEHMLTVCSCGHLGCTVLKNNVYTCEWCGAQGQITNYNGEGIQAGIDV